MSRVNLNEAESMTGFWFESHSWCMLCFELDTIIIYLSTGSSQAHIPEPHSAVSNVSGYKCMSDCRSRGREFDPGPVHTFVEIDHEIISTVILLSSAESFKKGYFQLQAKVCA